MSRLQNWLLIIGLFWSSPALGTVTIMPFGDSLTRGYQGSFVLRGSYREDVESFLTAISVDFDFVGDFRFARGNLADGHVQAVSGHTIQEMTSEFAAAVERLQPNVILVLAGTNNHWDDPSTTDFRQTYQSLVDTLFAASPDSQLIVSTIPPFGCCRGERFWTPSWLAERNAVRIPNMNRIIGEIAADDDRIAAVDLHAKINASDLVVDDWVHLNKRGQRKLAKLFIQELSSIDHGIVGAENVDAFAAQVRTGTGTPILDLDNSGVVDQNDFSYFVSDHLKTWRGDANLDGIFSSRDLVLVFQANQYEDEIASNSGWGHRRLEWGRRVHFTRPRTGLSGRRVRTRAPSRDGPGA
jgi:lysophospholipase L1-like esterase